MELGVNPLSLEAGRNYLEGLKKEKFEGYLQSCIDNLLEATDRGIYCFTKLGATEVEVLDLMIWHLDREIVTHKYPFTLLSRQTNLVCRRKRALGAHRMPEYAAAFIPRVVTDIEALTALAA